MTEELPKGWAWAKIGDICEVNPRRFDDPPEEDDLLSFVPMASVEAGTGSLDASQVKTYAEVKRKSLTPFQENDVIFSKITPCMENGKIALAEGLHGGRAVGSTEFMILRCGGNLNPKYLMHFLLQSSFRKEAERNMAGAVGQRRVPKSFISDYDIPVPPMAEQQRIVAALEAELSRLGASGDALESVLGKIKDLRVSLIKKLFQGSPRKLGDLFSIAVGATPSRGNSSNWGGDIPWVSSGEVSFGRIKETREYISKSALGGREGRVHPPGTVLLAMIGEGKTRGQVAILDIPAAHNQNCASIRVSEVGCSPEYVYYFLKGRYEETRRSGAGGNQLALNKAKVQEIEIPIVSPSGQAEIVERLDEAEVEMDRLQAQVVSAMQRANRLRQALLTAAFTGKLVPQDPSDEPASALLERIRAERAAEPRTKRGRKPKTTRPPKAPKTSVTVPDNPRPVPAGEQTALEF